jgi:hypothetical protein
LVGVLGVVYLLCVRIWGPHPAHLLRGVIRTRGFREKKVIWSHDLPLWASTLFFNMAASKVIIIFLIWTGLYRPGPLFFFHLLCFLITRRGNSFHAAEVALFREREGLVVRHHRTYTIQAIESALLNMHVHYYTTVHTHSIASQQRAMQCSVDQNPLTPSQNNRTNYPKEALAPLEPNNVATPFSSSPAAPAYGNPVAGLNPTQRFMHTASHTCMLQRPPAQPIKSYGSTPDTLGLHGRQIELNGRGDWGRWACRYRI